MTKLSGKSDGKLDQELHNIMLSFDTILDKCKNLNNLKIDIEELLANSKKKGTFFENLLDTLMDVSSQFKELEDSKNQLEEKVKEISNKL